MSYSRKRALQLLKIGSGLPNATFRDGQDDAIRHIVEGKGRLLVVQKTGWGKSFVYFIATKLLREAGAGPALLISPYDPSAGFNVGNAMQRNKLIYALAETSLVVNSDLNKGGTWAGAIEQLCNFKFVPVFVRTTGEASEGLDALRRKGALPWPNPHEADSFAEVFNVQAPPAAASPRVGFSLFDAKAAADTTPSSSATLGAAPALTTESEPTAPADVVSDTQPPAAEVRNPKNA